MRAGATTEVSSSWERHPLLVAGLQRLSATALVLLGLLFGADVALSRAGQPEGELSGLVARGAIGLAFAASLLALGLARRRRRELRRPAALATVVTLLVALAGALETLATGGVHGYFPGGLLVVLLFWPVLMPGGASTAALAVVGSVVLQGAVLVAAGELGLVRVALLSVVLVGLVLGYSQVLERWRRQLSAASRVDWLTGGMSWRALVEDLEVLCARRTRHWAPLTLVMFDVDRFERINDRHGQAFGDDVLELLDSAVRGETRGTDLLGRSRADEFLLVLDACDSQQALEIIARVRARLASTPLRAGSEEVRITFSAGVVTASRGAPIVAAELLKAAEQALLGSKEAQLNQTNLGGVGPAAAAESTAPLPGAPEPVPAALEAAGRMESVVPEQAMVVALAPESVPAQATRAGATSIAAPSSAVQATPAGAAVPSAPPLSTRRPAGAPSSAHGTGSPASAARGSPPVGTVVASRLGSIAPLVVPALSPLTGSANGIPVVPPVISSAQPLPSPGEPAAEVWRFPPAPPRSPTLAPPPPPEDDFEEAQILESE